MRILRLVLVVCLVGGLAGCRAQPKPSATLQKLHGTWYESRTGAEYQFATDSLLIVPHAQASGGNAVTYSVLPGDRLDVVMAPAAHRVSDISAVTTATLVLADPESGRKQTFLRDPGKTAFAKTVETRARVVASQVPTMLVQPQIVWVAPQPAGEAAEWASWSPATINDYVQCWNWTALTRDTAPARRSGSGDSEVYTFSFTRQMPTAAALKKYTADTGTEVSAGSGHIDVGYSATMRQYPAGTFVYLPGGLVMSLGGGYAIGVSLDRKNESFVPATHS